MNVKLTAAQKIRVLNSTDLYGIMLKVLLRENKIDRNKEHFWIVCLDTRNRILMVELISLGTVNSAPVEPMEVFSFALQKRAVKMIMVHNHPSGETAPSQNDIYLTDKMMAIGSFVNVPIIDHLIISEKEYYSFMDKGLLHKIMANSDFDLTFANIEGWKREIEQKTKQIEKTKKESVKKIEQAKIEFAKKLLKMGDPIDKIALASGLTKKQVQELKGKK